MIVVGHDCRHLAARRPHGRRPATSNTPRIFTGLTGLRLELLRSSLVLARVKSGKLGIAECYRVLPSPPLCAEGRGWGSSRRERDGRLWSFVNRRVTHPWSLLARAGRGIRAFSSPRRSSSGSAASSRWTAFRLPYEPAKSQG